MRVLYVVGTCLTKNTSANMSHNCYVQGLLENGCEVDIIMANDSWGQSDRGLPKWDEAHYYIYNNVSKIEKLRRRFRTVGTSQTFADQNNNAEEVKVPHKKMMIKKKMRALLKKTFYLLFPTDPVYPLEKEWIKNAANYFCSDKYDLVVSNSSPAASHKLVLKLLDRGNIKFERWLQIWEDPWYFDLYGGHTSAIKEEEHLLLSRASEIYYVSPLTLMYQKKYYPDCAEKMSVIPLPAMEYEKKTYDRGSGDIKFGYFGDYFIKTRDLKPFYDAMCLSSSAGYIYGDTDLILRETKNLKIKGRVTLDELAEIQEQTDVLVHLCNLRGGQIPGKIYHYSVTNKPILFILDGTAEEKKMLYNFFKRFERYYFCNNDIESILSTIKKIKKIGRNRQWEKVIEFQPKEVVKKILFREEYSIEVDNSYGNI
ncbi:glycosyltransferase family protein [Faecalimonas sp.]